MLKNRSQKKKAQRALAHSHKEVLSNPPGDRTPPNKLFLLRKSPPAVSFQCQKKCETWYNLHVCPFSKPNSLLSFLFYKSILKHVAVWSLYTHEVYSFCSNGPHRSDNWTCSSLLTVLQLHLFQKPCQLTSATKQLVPGLLFLTSVTQFSFSSLDIKLFQTYVNNTFQKFNWV